MDRNLLSYTVIATVAIILIGAMLAPLITNFTSNSTVTYTNGNGNRVSEAESITISGDSTTVTIGDDTYSKGSWTNYIRTDQFYLRTQSASTGLYHISYATDAGTNSIATITTFTLTASGGSWTLTYSTDSDSNLSVSGTYSWLFRYDPTGEWAEYGSSDTTRTIHVYSDDPQIYVANPFNSTGQWFYNDGSFAVTILGTGGPTSSSVINLKLTETKVRGVSSFAYANTDSDIGIPAATSSDPNYVIMPHTIIMPYQVSGLVESSVSSVQIITVIPALLIIALIVGFVALIRVRED